MNSSKSKESEQVTTTAAPAVNYGDFELSLIVYVLKNASSSTKTLKCPQIANILTDITGTPFNDKTVRKRLNQLFELYDAQESAPSSSVASAVRALTIIFAGTVKRISDSHTATKQKKHFAYYFQPLLRKSDADMINGAIISTKFVNEEERDYLLDRINILAATPLPQNELVTDASDHMLNRTLSPLPSKSNTEMFDMLITINKLHHAIKNKYKLQLVYGKYIPIDPKKPNIIGTKLSLVAKEEDGIVIISPYALLWCSGNYYLIAKRDDRDRLYHYRVDRIFNVKTKYNDKDRSKPEKSAPHPKNFQKYFYIGNNRQEYFDVNTYTKTYPHMSIPDTDENINCTFRCEAGLISVLVDNFGKELTVRASSKSRETDKIYYDVSVKNVSYLAARLLCIQQSLMITPVSPQNLVDDVNEYFVNLANKQ